MLKIQDVTFTYSRRKWPVIRDLSAEIKTGSVYGLLGKNGVGKTTLMMLMSGLLTPMKGSVTFYGDNVRRRSPSVMSDIFLMPEDVELPSIKLTEYIEINSPFYPNFSAEDMAVNLKRFNLESDIDLGQLSMGQRKKVMMSFALACNTRLLLMDEPINGLDLPGKEAVRRLIVGNMNSERTIIISSHRILDVDHLIDRVMIMADGKIVFDHNLKEITERLCFMVTDKREIIKEALFTHRTLGGVAVVLPNEENAETDIDMEMLFNLVLHNPGLIEYLFNDK